MTSDLEMYGIAVAQSRGIASLLVTYFISPTPWPGQRDRFTQSGAESPTLEVNTEPYS